MKLLGWYLSLALLAGPAVAAPSYYTMAFTGGIPTNSNGGLIPLAPESGSFTYDSTAGFSSFVIQYLGETFDMTSAVNAAGTPTSTLNLLTENATWTSAEVTLNNVVVSNIQLSNKITGYAALFPGFSLGDLARSGAYTLSSSVTPPPPPPPPPTVPEPAAGSLVLVAGLGLLGLRWMRRGNRLLANESVKL